MSILQNIRSPINQEMTLFEKKFKSSLKNKTPLLNRILYYIIKRKGKQIRPMFVFLSAKLFGDINESTYRAASMIELLHTATLVHDDVIDEANFRRGFFSINAIWQNKIAVLVGDFLLSRGLLLAVDNNETDLLKIVSSSVKEMSEGELLQIEKTRRLDITEDVYFDIIKKKTGSLISSCCSSGANSVIKDPSVIEKMRLFGEKAGVCFQIKDDLFDFTDNVAIGKPIGIDLQGKKITLPLIYTLNNVSKKIRQEIIYILKNHTDNKKEIAKIISIVKESDGVTYSLKKMNEYKNDALNILKEFQDCEAKKSLIELLNYVINRKA